MAVVKEIAEGNYRICLYNDYAEENKVEKRKIADHASAIIIESLGKRAEEGLV